MKTYFLFPVVLLLFSSLSWAKPRLTVSTPSLVPESEVDVIFNQPMVSEELLGKEVENTLVKIEPSIPAKLFWKAPTIAELRFQENPEIGNEYRFSVSGDLKHVDGSAVEKGEFSKVSTESFRIYTARINNRWGRDYSPATAAWMIVLNDDVDPEKIAGFFSFGSKTNQSVAANIRHANAKEAGYFRTNYLAWKNRQDPKIQRAKVAPETLVKNIVVVSPNSPLPAGKDWSLRVLKGLPNEGKSTALKSDMSYRIGTVEAFKVSSVSTSLSATSPRRLVVRFNRVIAQDLAENAILVSPEPPNLSKKINGKALILDGDFSGFDQYKVSVAKSVVSASGDSLSSAKDFSVTFKRLNPYLALPSQDEAQFANGQREYQIDTTNLSKLKIRIKKLDGRGIVRAMQGYRNYTGNGPDYSGINPVSIIPYSLISGETVVEKEIDLGIEVDTGKRYEISWDEWLPADLKKATLFLDVIGTPHLKSGEEAKRNAQAIVQLTDIGLAWKFTKESALVFAFSCETGLPMEGVKLNVFGEDASPITNTVTDASGLAKLPRSSKVRHLQALHAGDSYAVAFDRTLDRVGMWHFPVRYSWMQSLPETRRAFMFTDRSLYRPGETVRVKGIVRSQNGNEIAMSKGAVARVTIVDPKDKEIFTDDVEISKLGSFDFQYALPSATTGRHTIRLDYPEELLLAEETEDWEKQIALRQSASFSIPLNVEEFRRNTFEIEQKIEAPLAGATEVKAKLTATYYQGQPVAVGKASVFTEITETNPYPERFRDFLFGDHRVDDWRYWYHYFGYRDQSGDNSITRTTFNSDLVLSKEGFTEIPVSLPSGDFPVARNVSIATEVTDANDQTLTARSRTIVHPASIYAGISRLDQLVRVDDEATFRFVAVTSEGDPVEDDVTVKVTLTRQVHANTKTSNANGDTVTESTPRDELVFEKDVNITAASSAKEGLNFPISPKETGLHFLKVSGKDAEGRNFATVTRFRVYGSKEYPWRYEDGMRIKLVSEKKSYQPGDVARVLVLSPIEGKALVTVEREKVLSSFLTEISADNPVIEIPLDDGHAPNAYVSVLIVRGAADSERKIKEPKLRLGYCELTVENQKDRLEVAIQSPSQSYRPGTEVTLVGKVSSSDGSAASGAEVTLYAVDEGTLAVMGYDTPDPMAFFYNPRRLQVEAGTSFQMFISENSEYRSFFNKGFVVGGGGDLSKLADLMRKNFDPCAAWAPTLVTNEAGEFSHSFELPDTLTRYRLVAVAHHGGGRFGHDESELLVKKPLMLEPKLPRFAHQGDRIVSQVMVQNASGQAGTWEVVCATSGGEQTSRAILEGSHLQSLTLQDGESAVLTYPIKITDTGEVTISYRARPLSLPGGELTPELEESLSDAVRESFQSHFPMPLLRQVESLRIKANNPLDLRKQLNENLSNASGHVEFEFATSPLVEISSSVKYLLQYPYGCAEQTSSSLMPWFAVKSLRPYVPSFAKKSDREVHTAIQMGVDRLLSMQQTNGSFGYWPGATTTTDWVTPYAGMALVLAKQHGGNVPESSLEKLSQYLIASLRGAGEAKTSRELETHAKSLYTLALMGKSQPPYHALMAEKLPFMDQNSRALLAAAVAVASEGKPKELTIARQILTSKVEYKPLENGNYWRPGNSSGATDLLAWSAIDARSIEADRALDQLLKDRNPYGHWRSTWVNGWSLLAVSNYAADKKIEDEPIVLVLETNEGRKELTLSSDQPTGMLSLPLGPTTKMNLSANLPAYVRMNISGKPAIAPVAPVSNNGLVIERIYEKVLSSGQTEILATPAKGDLIRVTLRVTMPNDDSRYVVIDDPLPSTFETVNSKFASQASAQVIRTSENDWKISHSELRSDRAVFFLDRVWKKGTYNVTYLARCTMAGEVTAPPAKVESMYDPENFALSASREFSSN
ncbi:MAG: alpha-2-macroglobulin [Akkermansiaceae bacterium]